MYSIQIVEYGPPRAQEVLRRVVSAFVDGGPVMCRRAGKESVPATANDPLPLSPGWPSSREEESASQEWFLHGRLLAAPPVVPELVWRHPRAGGVAAIDARCRWMVEHYEWAIIRWFNTYSEQTLAFISASEALTQQCSKSWRMLPETCAWDAPESVAERPMLLSEYAVTDPYSAFRIVQFEDHDLSGGRAVWEVCDCSVQQPLAILHMPDSIGRSSAFALYFEEVAEPRRHPRSEATRLVRLRTPEAFFELTRETPNGESHWTDDVGWTLVGGELAAITAAGIPDWSVQLRDHVHLLQRADWLYCKHGGGGPGEYYNVFGARDSSRTGRLMRRLESQGATGSGILGVF